MSSVQQFRRLFLFALFCVAQAIFLLSPIFKITHIEVEGNHLNTDQAIIAMTSLYEGEYYWAYLFSRGGTLQKSEYFLHASIDLESHGVVKICVDERVPVALVYSDTAAGNWLLVDSDGFLLGPPRDDKPYPRLKVDFVVPSTGRIHSALISVMLKAREATSSVIKLPVLFYSVDSTQSVSVFTLFQKHSMEIKLGSLDNLKRKISILKVLLPKLEKRGKPLDSIDVRFSNPAVMDYRPNAQPSPLPTAAVEKSESSEESAPVLESGSEVEATEHAPEGPAAVEEAVTEQLKADSEAQPDAGAEPVDEVIEEEPLPEEPLPNASEQPLSEPGESQDNPDYL